MKLHWKHSIFLALSLVVLLGLFSILSQRFLAVQVVREAASHSALIADTIHLGLAQSMISNNRDAIQLSLRDILISPEISEVLIVDSQGRVVFSSHEEMMGRNLKHSSYVDLDKKKGWKVVDGEGGAGRDILRFSPIPNRSSCQECHPASQAVLGNVAVRLPLSRAEEMLKANRYFLAGLMSLVLVFIFFGNERFFSKQVRDPIEALIGRFQEVRDGGAEPKAVPDAGGPADELGVLRRSFEELLREVNTAHEKERAKEMDFVLQQQDRAHQEEMKEMNLNLSERVRELDEANRNVSSLAHKLEEKNESLQNAVKSISALNRVGVALSSELDISRLVKLLINLSAKGLRAEIGYIMFMNEGELTMQSWTGMGGDFDHTLTVKAGESLAGRVAETGQAVLFSSINGSEGVNRVSRFGFTRRSAIGAPIKMKDRLLGVIELANKKGSDGFDEDDLVMMQSIANQAAVAIENAQLYREVQKSYFDTIRALVQAVEETDKYTRGHSERVTTFSLKIAEKMDYGEKQLQTVRYAGVLHDIGKIGINVNIIQKPDRLTEEEFEIIKSHPLIGERIIGPIAFLKDVIPAVRQHHERYDGLGYPLGLEGSQMVPEARILAVADAYDAMITARPYRNPLPKKDAVAELRRWSGRQFDPMVVEVFLDILEEDQEIRELEESLSEVGT